MSRSATATLTALGVGAAGELTTAPARALPVRGELAGLLPWGGLRRGSTVSVRGSTSLLLALMAAATGEGCWAAVVGLPGCGALAAAELGVAVHRLALVPRPGRDQGEVEKTVAALLDGFDLVALATPVTPATSRKLSARARHRKAVLLPFTVPWPGSDVELTATSGQWTGLSTGHGLLTSRTVTVQATGRGAAARPRRTTVVLPGNVDVPARRPTLAPVPNTDPPRSPTALPAHPPSAGSLSTDLPTPASPTADLPITGSAAAGSPSSGVPAAALSAAGALNTAPSACGSASADLPTAGSASPGLPTVGLSVIGSPGAGLTTAGSPGSVPAGPPADSSMPSATCPAFPTPVEAG
ncbi:hypothetical protein ACFYOT_08585 [Saccharothrix saharensis]|uniref:hypothetical protein n=1 Tax=Saccharothrix saharensis TaxID=571190 RepID=UPI0036D0029F